MSPDGSVSDLLAELKAGDAAAAQQLWERYCDRLLRLARKKLPQRFRRVADEEDVALSAFNSLCQGAKAGRFPKVTDSGSLWGLLVFITAQKTADWIAYHRRKKRGAGQVRGDSAIRFDPAASRAEGFDAVFSGSPGPATLNVWAEEYQRLLARLDDATLRRIAELSVQGYTIQEIAGQLGLAKRTIDRKLRLIRTMLLAETPNE